MCLWKHLVCDNLISIVASKSMFALTFVFFTKADVIEIDVERGDRIVST